jgi:Flp pilus assembly protein TadG
MSRRRALVTRATDLARIAQRGQTIVWTAIMLPLFLTTVGLAADGGLVFAARRELQNVADSAARAGAQQIDVQAYRESRGRSVVLDEPAARWVAAEYGANQQPGLDVRVDVEPRRVRVLVTRNTPTSFTRLVGIESVRVTASATAEVQHGIERGEP